MTNNESYRIASPFAYKARVWTLLTLASILVGIGVGWVLVRLLSERADLWFMAAFGAAGLLILAAFIIERHHSRPRRRRRETLRQGIDLKHLQKSLISYGFQPPVIETTGLRTQLLKISRRTEVPNNAPLVIIQHFDGIDMLIRSESTQKDYVLRRSTLVRIDFSPSDINRQIVFLPLEESHDSTGYVLVHCVVNE